MVIRPYDRTDCDATRRLFRDTIEDVCAGDYAPAQLSAWQSGCVDAEAWNRSLEMNAAVVAEEDGVVVGFADVSHGGYLDRLYVRKDYQRRGFGRQLIEALEELEGPITATYASITAVPFFESMGFEMIRENAVERQGVMLENYLMERKRRVSTELNLNSL